MNSIRAIAIAALLLSTLILVAQDQEVEKDVETWIAVKATKRFDFDLNVSLEQQVRFPPYQQTFTEIGLEYKALGFLLLGSEMRFKFLKGGTTEYRLAGFAGIEADKKDFEIEYRFKATTNFSRFDETLLVLRNKVNLKYTIKKDWRINTSFETFQQKEDGYFWLRKYRWTLGLRHKFTKMHLLTVFYGIERTGDLDEDDPIVLRHLFGTRYDLRW